MSGCELVELQSVDELRAVAALWDDLWLRSDVTDPTARAEMIAQWIERFAPQATFRAIILRGDDRFLAALPLVEEKVRGLIRAGQVPSNAWCHGGGLLVAQEEEADEALDVLVSGLRRLPWQLLWFECIRLESAGYMALRDALVRGSIPHSVYPQYQVALIPTCGDWEGFLATLGSSTRCNLRRRARRLQEVDSDAGLRYYAGAVPDPEELVAQAFAVEDLSWKGEAGSSVIRRGMLGFYQREAKQMADWGYFATCFLEANGKAVASQYGYIAKGVYHSCKIGYDPQYSSLGPGQLLRSYLLRQCFFDPDIVAFDCLGELTPAIATWRPRRYWVGQLVIAPRGLCGRLVEFSHARLWPTIWRVKSKLLRRGNTTASAANQ